MIVTIVQPTFIRLKVNNDACSSDTVKVTFRLHTEANRVRFRRVLEEFSWNSLASEDVENYMENFSSALNKWLYCECFPIKTKTFTRKRSDNPWIHKLLQLKSSHFKMFKLWIFSKQENNYLKNKVKTIVDKSKLNYYKTQFPI